MKYTYTVTTKRKTKTFSDLEEARIFAAENKANRIYGKIIYDNGNMETIKYKLIGGRIHSFEKM